MIINATMIMLIACLLAWEMLQEYFRLKWKNLTGSKFKQKEETKFRSKIISTRFRLKMKKLLNQELFASFSMNTINFLRHRSRMLLTKKVFLLNLSLLAI